MLKCHDKITIHFVTFHIDLHFRTSPCGAKRKKFLHACAKISEFKKWINQIIRIMNNKKEDPRNKKIELRVSESEKIKYQKKAATSRLTISEYLREFLENGQVNIVEIDNGNDTEKMIYDERKVLIGIGSNLNQLTRYTHQNKKLHQDIEMLIEELKSILIN